MRSGQHFKNKIENNDKILELAAWIKKFNDKY